MSDFDISWIKKYIQHQPKVIFDIGCYVCQESMQFKEACPDAQVYSFEASPDTYNRLMHNPYLVHNLNIFNIALSDKDGEIDFFKSYGVNDCSGSILESQHTRQDLKFSAPVKVKTMTISSFCASNNIENIDMIHMDVQGAEYYVMKGIGNFRPTIIFAETAEYENYKNSLTKDDLDNLMRDLGYEVKERLQFDTLYILRGQ